MNNSTKNKNRDVGHQVQCVVPSEDFIKDRPRKY